MRQRLLGGVLLVFVSAACGGENGGSPTGPSRQTTQQAPNLVAGWGGTFTSTGVIVQTGQRATAACEHTWVITAQNGGQFSGTFQSAGCGQGGTLSGNVSSSGALSNLTFSVSVGQASLSGFNCTRVAGSEVFAGVASSASITAQASDQLRCTGNGITADLQRSMSLSMNRR